MKLSELSKKPQLIEVLIDDEDTVKEFGEPLSFHTWDRQPVDLYVKLANLATDKGENPNVGELINLVRTLVLNEEGQEIISQENSLPMNVLTKVIQKVTDLLGK